MDEDLSTQGDLPTGDPSTSAVTGSVSPDRSPGADRLAQIGPYKVLEVLGEGGMGIVYLAEQASPVKRRVALKVIKLGMDTKQVVARFEAERQALAMMDHPNVARVYDGGQTEQGRPYFVMEHVPGVPITEHCDRQRLGIPERIGLFLRVCEAIQHAHQKGIIHRDVKPSNVLVSVRDGEASPKVIDFGVAKATLQPLTDRTLFTEQGQLIGTTEYMSPEQAEMTAQDIDTRSDIYSLGVLLYELLTGVMPFDKKAMRGAAFNEIQRIIREVEPPKPSTRLSLGSDETVTSAKNRHAEPRSLAGELRGDLDWIVMKAMEKDRSRRYESASGLAADLRRHLNHEPVIAGPPSAAYRMRKFVRRNRAGVLAACVALALLVSGIVGTTWGLIQANVARDEAIAAQAAESAQRALAMQRADELQQVADFQSAQLGMIDVEAMGAQMIRSIVAGAPEGSRESLEASLAEVNFTNVAMGALEENVFDRTIDAIDAQFQEQPLVRAQLLHAVASTLRELGLLERAHDPQRRALAIQRAALGDDHLETLKSFNNMGALLRGQGKLAEAEPYYREALEGNRRTLGDDHPDTLRSVSNFGSLLQSLGRMEEAERYYREALEGNRRVLGEDHPQLLTSINNMGFLLRRQGKLAEAEPLYREALEGRRRVLGDDHPDTMTSINNMGFLLQRQGKLAEAEPYFREALEGSSRILGDDHPDTMISRGNLALLLADLGVGGEALRLADEAVATGRRALGAEHWLVGNFLGKRGRALQTLGRYTESEAAMLKAHAILVAVRGESHRQSTRVAGYLAELYEEWDEAEPDAGHAAQAARWRAREAGEE